MLSY
jgi:hypothetical protein